MELIKIKKQKHKKEPIQNNKKQSSTNTTTKKHKPPVYEKYEGVSSPSLKNIKLNDHNEKTEDSKQKTNIENKKTENFNQDELNNVWGNFVDEIKDKLPRFYLLFKNQTPQLTENYNIQVQVDSQLQKKDIKEKIYNEMSSFLTKNLNNDKIIINLKIKTDKQEQNIIYTDADKYKYLVKKNKNLEALKQLFNLDF